MNYTIKTSNPETVNDILGKKSGVEITNLNNFPNDLKLNETVLIVLGGDKVEWEKGFIGFGHITTLPYDFEGRNYKVKIDVDFLLENPMTKYDLRFYPGIFNVTFIGPMTKGEPNQAIQRIELSNIKVLLRAILDLDAQHEEALTRIFGEETMEECKQRIEYLETQYRSYSEKQQVMEQSDVIKEQEEVINFLKEEEFVTGGHNLIVYGAPGTGKSYELSERYKNIERVVFHPEYTYHDFVGSYKPVPLYKKIDGNILRDSAGREYSIGEPIIDYQFVPGPFTKVLIKAFKQPHILHTLVIEEINRANTAAVFGDIFQLLDRDANGKSEYEIQINQDLCNYLIRQGVLPNQGSYSLFIPSNLNIVATMNSADQGVFPLDSAFKRRWRFEYLPINIDDAFHASEEIYYGDMKVTWGQLVKNINLVLTINGVNEDKHIGPYFLTQTDLKDQKIFSSKLLVYLWDDVLRHNRAILFKSARTFSELVQSYEKGEEIFTFNINDVLDIQESEIVSDVEY
ncbi:AAA family ATPase [Bacillus sp. LS15-K4]|nr:AAA family ATPase [Bacillus sp. LS15-K4]MDJ1478256.1 AAA family ATPase [Bacillus sp. LS15-K4]